LAVFMDKLTVYVDRQ